MSRRLRLPVKPCFHFSGLAMMVRIAAVAFCLVSLNGSAATFTNNASIKADSGTALTFSSGPFTVSCWFRVSIPSAITVTQDMVMLMDRTDGNDGAPFSYLIRYSAASNRIEFATRDSSGATYVRPLIDRPYLERWYHVAVTRSGGGAIKQFNAYVDGRALSPFQDPVLLADTSGTGLALGGVNGGAKLFFGDIIEVSIFQTTLALEDIQQLRFTDATSFGDLLGYYKLSSTNEPDQYRNFASGGANPAMKVGSGTIGFEETDQAGEQSTFDSRKNHGDSALAPLSGAFTWQQTAISRPVPGIAFDFRVGYSTGNPATPSADGAFDPYDRRVLGPGWRHTFDTRLFIESSANEIKLLSWDGSIETWFRTNLFAPLSVRHKEYRGELMQLGNGDLEWTTPERLVYHFRDPISGGSIAGRLLEIRDFQTNVVRIVWDTTNRYINQVIDTAGGRWQFGYTTNRYLTNVSFADWQVRFEFDSANRLKSKTLTNTVGTYANVSTTWRFEYANPSNGPLTTIIDPRGNTNVFVQYDQYVRKTNEVDALARTNATFYGAPGKRQITRIDPGTNSWIETYDRKGRILAQQDPLTNVTRYTYDSNGNRTSITEPRGWKTFFAYDDRANVIARTNALKQVTQWSFHAFFNKPVQEITPQPLSVNGQPYWTNRYAIDDRTGNLTNHSDDLGRLVSYTYWSNGLVRTSTDGNGNTTTFGYNTNGFLTTRTDPATNTTTFEYNDLGWKTSEMDALYNWTDYEYDLNGNVVQITDPLFRRFFRTYDGNGNLVASSDGKQRFTTNIYDSANQKVATIDRTGTNVTRFAYTSRGKLEFTTNAHPLRFVTRYSYDAANRLTNVTDALTNSAITEFDANGNEVAMIDKAGQRWPKTFDELNRVIGESDPFGNTKETAYDEAGRVKEIRTPNGYPSLHFYDGRGRLTNWIDAENFPWKYAYDGNANITKITDALTNDYVMGYSNRNERIFEKNQDGETWHYTYDELLRLSEQRDPNNVTRTVQYDDAGRVDEVLFSTGRKHSFVYDDNNNVELVTRRDNATSQPVPTRFMYDVLDRPFEQSDVYRQTVIYGYDPLGRITSKTYPGGKILTQDFDALGRLTNQVFDFGSRKFTNAYAYDKAGRLVQHSYPNGITQSNSFDVAGRITGLSHAPAVAQASSNNPIAIALTYAYDRNGNKVGGTEKGTLGWQLPALTDENANFTAAGKLIDRTIATLSTNGAAQTATNGFLYDPSGNLTNWSGNGQSYALTYDEDNRTKQIVYSTSVTNVTISNRYDALGRRVSRTLNGSETRYVLDLSGDMDRILCDLDTNGVLRAWYVHGPDLAFRVDAVGDTLCYHADAQANVIALSGTNGTTVAQYAYSPYGRVLGSSNQISGLANPYLFVGSQGVMEELPGLYFMRARYYSADAGVFLSTDPVKNIGPGWKSVAYAYAEGNPLSKSDPEGEFAALYYKIEQSVLRPINDVLDVVEAGTSVFAGEMSRTEFNEYAADWAKQYGFGKAADFVLPGTDVGGWVSPLVSKDPVGGLIDNAAGYIPLKQTWDFSGHLKNISGNIGAGIGNRLHDIIYNRNVAPRIALSSPTAGTTPMANLRVAPSPQTPFGLPSAQISSGNRSLSSRTATVGSYAQNVTAQSQTRVATSTGPSGGGGRLSTAVNNATTAVRNSANSVVQAVRSGATTVANAFSSAVRYIGNFFFGR